MLKTKHEITALHRLLVEVKGRGFTYSLWLIIVELNDGHGNVSLEFRTTSEPQAASPVQLHDIPRIKRALEHTGKYLLAFFEPIKTENVKIQSKN